MRCRACSALVPHHAKYCPVCGAPAPKPSVDLPRARGAIPSTGPIPRLGKIFFALLALALGFVGAGILGGGRILFVVGGAVVAVLILVMIVGDLVG